MCLNLRQTINIQNKNYMAEFIASLRGVKLCGSERLFQQSSEPTFYRIFGRMESWNGDSDKMRMGWHQLQKCGFRVGTVPDWLISEDISSVSLVTTGWLSGRYWLTNVLVITMTVKLSLIESSGVSCYYGYWTIFFFNECRTFIHPY